MLTLRAVNPMMIMAPAMPRANDAAKISTEKIPSNTLRQISCAVSILWSICDSNRAYVGFILFSSCERQDYKDYEVYKEQFSVYTTLINLSRAGTIKFP